MATICDRADIEEEKLAAFKETEWPLADREHFGDAIPDFTASKHTLVLTDREEIVGYVSYTVEQGVVHIDSLIVGSAHRGKGHAKRLMNEAEGAAKNQGAHRAILETGAAWEARHLYASLGYTVLAELPDHFGRQDFVLMGKSL